MANGPQFDSGGGGSRLPTPDPSPSDPGGSGSGDKDLFERGSGRGAPPREGPARTGPTPPGKQFRRGSGVQAPAREEPPPQHPDEFGGGRTVPGTGGTVVISEDGETVTHVPTGETRKVEDVAPTGEDFGTGRSVPGTGGTVVINDDGTVTHVPTGETRDPWDPAEGTREAADNAADAAENAADAVTGGGLFAGLKSAALKGVLILAAIAAIIITGASFAKGAGRGVTE